MIRMSFCCFRGVGESAERRLWRDGVLDWDRFLAWPRPLFSERKWGDVREQIFEAKVAYTAQAFDYFVNRFQGIHKSRLLPEVADRIGYLDIETDGLRRGAVITSIALRVGGQTGVFVRGRNLSDFIPAVGKCLVLVTFNGARFDLPRLRREFRMNLACTHIDLLPVTRAMGCRGGLKDIERSLGLVREQSAGMNGVDAVSLWQRHVEQNDEDALRQLTRYNAEDSAMLETLLRLAYRRSMELHPSAA